MYILHASMNPPYAYTLICELVANSTTHAGSESDFEKQIKPLHMMRIHNKALAMHGCKQQTPHERIGFLRIQALSVQYTHAYAAAKTRRRAEKAPRGVPIASVRM